MRILILLAAAMVLMPAPSGRASGLASTNLCADELLLKLAEPNDIVAVTRISGDDESEAILRKFPHIERIHGEAEELLDLNARHVFTGPVLNATSAAMFRKLGIRVTEIPVAGSLEEMAGIIRKIAAEVGQAERGEALLKRYEGILRVDTPEPGAPSALFWDAGGHTAGSGTFEHAVLEAAGLRNAAALSGIHGHAWLSVEEVIFMKPDMMILRYGSKRDGAGYDGVHHPAIQKALPDLKQIFLPRSTLACGGPAALETILALQKEVSNA